MHVEGKRARWKGHEAGVGSYDQKSHVHCEPKEPGTFFFFFFFFFFEVEGIEKKRRTFEVGVYDYSWTKPDQMAGLQGP